MGKEQLLNEMTKMRWLDDTGPLEVMTDPTVSVVYVFKGCDI